MRKVKIADRYVGLGEPVFIVAEAGVNHNGDIHLAKRLVAIGAEAGADAVKFQTWSTDKIVTKEAPKARYQVKQTGGGESQYEMLKRLELSHDAFRELKALADELEIIFLSTPDEEDSADFLASLGVPAIKIGSGEVTNLPYLEFVARKGLPIILSTGMSTLGEVEAAVETIHHAGNDDLILLHCTSNYPAAVEDANLKAMVTLQQAFQVPVGYSDHTLGIEVALAAVALGAVVIEKHFTLDKSLPGPDHAASLSPEDLKAMVCGIRRVETALGSAMKRPVLAEQDTRQVARKSVVAAVDIPQGTTITREMLALKRPGVGIKPEQMYLVVGRKAQVDIAADELIRWEHV